MNSPAFSVFCDALADNKTLIELDLRNNDINHVGGSELATALKRNTTLRALGISMNDQSYPFSIHFICRSSLE